MGQANLRTLGNRVRVRGDGEGMQMRAAIKLVARPLSALSLVVPMMGMLSAVAVAGVAVASALAVGPALADGCPHLGRF